MRYTTGDILRLQGIWREDDLLSSSCEVGGDPPEGCPLDSELVKSVDQCVVGYGVECCGEVQEDEGYCFSLV